MLLLMLNVTVILQKKQKQLLVTHLENTHQNVLFAAFIAGTVLNSHTVNKTRYCCLKHTPE